MISGGQTGADRAGLECAKAIGLETGGTAPKGYWTETGSDLSLKDFGLTESVSVHYKPRTWANVRDADVTLWFGKLGSPGYWCTKQAAGNYGKLFIENPVNLQDISETYEVINVAGNRASKNPDVIQLVKDAFATLGGTHA